MNAYRHATQFELGPVHVAIRRPSFSVSKSAKRDFERVKEGSMSKANARRRDSIRIRSAAIVRG